MRAFVLSILLYSLGGASALFSLPFNQFVIFGDSLSDSGNGWAVYQVAPQLFPPNPPLPIPPNYQTGEFTSGPQTTPASHAQGVWVDQLAPKLGVPVAQDGVLAEVLGQPITGTNFAIAGTQTSFEQEAMGGQVQIYLATHPAGVPNNALYILWGGANDIALNNGASGTGLTAASNIKQQITMLAQAGARYFLWPNLQPLNEAPGVRLASPTIQTDIAEQTLIFNLAWAVDIAQLRFTYPGIRVIPLDVYSLYRSIDDDPERYGLVNTTDSSQGNPSVDPDRYLYWDDTHPTAAAHGLIADLARDKVKMAFNPEPASYALVAGACLIGLVCRRRQRRRMLTRESV